MSTFSIPETATILGVSNDTVRRRIDLGQLAAVKTSGRWRVDGTSLAAHLENRSVAPSVSALGRQSARNRLDGIVTRVVRDSVMAQVDIQAGPFRVVSLMSREAADELGLNPGVRAVASIKATNVVIEVPSRTQG